MRHKRMEKNKQKLNSGMIKKISGLIKDNARMAREGMIYYLDTLRKLPGAYMVSKDQVKADTLSRKRIKGLEDIQAIGERIEQSKTKMSSIEKWVNLAKEGMWSEGVKKRIERFDASAGGLKRKAELLEFNYRYFMDLLLIFTKDELDAFFIVADTS